MSRAPAAHAAAATTRVFHASLRPRVEGFTLIEIVGAFFMTVVILVFVTGIFVENGRQREAATALMHERLGAAAALDLIGADLGSAILLARGEEEEPNEHPWRFTANAPSELGATALRFVTQAGPRLSPASGSSSWIEVAYFLAEDEEGRIVLWRWQSPRPPSQAPSAFPGPDDPGAMRVAVGIANFGVRALDGAGAWLDEWDSTFLPPAQALPEAVEISIQMQRAVRPGEAIDDPEATEIPGRLQSRRVALAMRPLDVAALIALGQEGEEGEECFTVDDCLATGDSAWFQQLLGESCGGDDRLCEVLRDSGKTCWSTVQTTYPAIAARAPAGCTK
jgi:Type II secretion system (T2SS), protein J